MMWTQAQDELLRESRGKMPTRLIASLLGTTPGSVVGRAKRLGLERMKGSPATYRTSRKPTRPRPKRKPQPPIHARTRDEDLAIPFERRKTLLELTDQTCRYPVGDPDKPEFFFCGAKSLETYPYCAGHCAVAYESFRCVVDDGEQHAVTPAAA